MYGQIQDVGGRSITGVIRIFDRSEKVRLLEITIAPLPEDQRIIISDLPFVQVLLSYSPSFDMSVIYGRAQLHSYEFFNTAPRYDLFYAKYTWHFDSLILRGARMQEAHEEVRKKAPKKRELPDYDWMVEGF